LRTFRLAITMAKLRTLFIVSTFILVNLFTNELFAQDYKRLDSLGRALKKAGNDTLLVGTYEEMFWEYYGIYNDSALLLAKKAITYSEKNNFTLGLVDGYRLAGMAYAQLSNYPEALKFQQLALKKCDETKSLKRKANILNNLSTIYQELKDYKTALYYQSQCLDLCLKLRIMEGVSSSYGNMGNIYKNLKQIRPALKYYEKSLALDKKNNNFRGYANSLGNIGGIYTSLPDSIRRSFKLSESEKYNKALSYYNRSLKIRDSLGFTAGITSSYISIGNVYLELNNFEKALDYFNRALSLAEETGSLDQQKSCYEGMYQCHKKLGHVNEALFAFEKCDRLKDSILNDAQFDELNQLKTKYALEQKDVEYQSEREREKIITEKDKQRQRIILYSSVAGLILTIIFLYFIFKRYRYSLRQQEIIQQQKRLVETKNKEITDSINYAKRIQEAMLTSEQEFCTHFTKAFVLFRPKDIVSGDFYWVQDLANTDNVIFVLGDCTGHGVPGGFMSVLAINLMNEVVNERGVHEPAEILNVLRDRIKTSLKQDGAEGTSRDGMDVTIGKLNRKTNKLTYAAANRMLYAYSNGELKRHNGNKMPVGYFEQEETFVQFEVQLNKGDIIYFFTDGFVDQIGGELGRKLKYPNFENALKTAIESKTPLDKNFFDEVFLNWKKQHHQVDDVCLVGIEV
jgi:serine phosphatase RsbU (regulator of sigma subunit)